MDIYRKELNQIYASQMLGLEKLSVEEFREGKTQAEILAGVSRGAAVVTDASCDRCYIYGGSLGRIMGFFKNRDEYREETSSDEDIIYYRIHPEDLVDKRLLEYEFFSFVSEREPSRKLDYKAICKVRMKDSEGNYRYIDNTTQILRLSPAGKMWLILCCYNLSPVQERGEGISPSIIDTASGEVKNLQFKKARSKILSEREKEILLLIKQGLPSKLIADTLHISLHTVNRHRQNIISKLSVANSIEAVMAAQSMNLL